MKKILFEIEVENVGATRRIDALREEIKRLNKEIKGVNEGSDEYRKLTGNIANAQIEIKDLKEQQKALNREFQAAKFPKDSLQGLRIEYGKLAEQLKSLSAAERSSPFGQSIIANAANVKKQIDGIEQSIGRFTGNVGNYRSAFASVSEILTGGLIGGGAVVTINALTNAFSKGLTALFEYEKGLDRLSAITGVTGQALGDLEKRAESLTTIDIGGSKIVSTAQDIFEAFTLVGSARPELLEDAAALEEVTKQAIILSKASGDDLKTSVAAVTTTLGQFKLGAGDSVRIINELAAGSKLGASEIVDTTIALKKFGTTAAVSNVSTAESIALIETLADRQLKGEEAGTQLRNILAKLSGAEILPKKALAELEQAGVSLDVLKDTTLPLITRLQELGKLQGNTAALTKVFGLENLAAAQIITQGIPKYQALLEGVQGTNEAYIQAGIQADNAAQRFENLQNKGINLLTNAFLSAEPAISGVIELLDDIVTLLSESPDIFSENAEEFTALSFAVLAFTRTAQTAAVTTTAMTASQLSWSVALRGAAVAQAISTAATQAMTVAMNAMPLIAVVAGVYAIVKAFQAYEDSASASEKASAALADAQADIATESAKEVSALRSNIEILKSEQTGRDRKKQAIDDLVKAYPDYLKNINLEKVGVEQLTGIQNQLIDSIIRQGIERRKNVELEKVDQKLIDQRLEQDRLRAGNFTALEKVERTLSANAEALTQSKIERSVEVEKELLQVREEIAKQFDRAKPFELTLVVPEKGVVKGAADEVRAVGNEATAAGDKIGGLGDKSKKTKDEINAQAGSIAALKDEISKLQKQIEATDPKSERFSGLIRQLDFLQGKLKDTERAFESAKFRARGGKIEAPKIQAEKQPALEFEAELKPDATEQLRIDAQAAKLAVEADLQTIEFDVTIKKPSNQELDQARQIFDLQSKEAEKKAADEKKAFEEKQEIEDQAKEAAITSAQTVADSLTQIQSNRLQRETDAKLAQLDLDTQGQIAAAQGNEAKIKAIEKDSAIKRAAIEKEAARERKKIAVREAIINTALAITKALTGAPPPANFILAGVSAAAGAAQLAVINSQEFAAGGVVQDENKRKRKGDVLIEVSEFADGGMVEKVVRFNRNDVTERIEELATGGTIKRLKPGIITDPQNAPRTAGGDTVLAYLAPGEMVLNEPQQNTLRSLFGQDAFALAGVPGEASTRRNKVPGFASGGVVGIVPQNGFAQQVSGQPVSVDARAEFSGEQIDELGQSMGTIIAAEVAKQLRVGLAEGLFDANRRLEREEVLNQNRQG